MLHPANLKLNFFLRYSYKDNTFQASDTNAPDYSGYVSLTHLKTAILALIRTNHYNAETIVNIVAQVSLTFWNGVLLQKKNRNRSSTIGPS